MFILIFIFEYEHYKITDYRKELKKSTERYIMYTILLEHFSHKYDINYDNIDN